MAQLNALDIDDLVASTLYDLGPPRFQNIAQNLQDYEVFTKWFKKDKVIFDSGIEVDDDVFVALQHQDILTQQMSAIMELSQALQKHLRNYEDYETLESKFLSALEIAKAKKEAYRGKAF